MSTPHVMIVGAGAAGLAAARDLCRAGRSVLILEARDRIGGRIHTLYPPGGPRIELGAEFIHGTPDSTWDLVHESGILAYDLPFEHWRREGKRLMKVENFSHELGKVMGGLSRLKKDVSFAEYLRRRDDPAAARRLALDFVQGFDAADPEKISSKSIATEQEGLGDVGEEMQFRLMNGYAELVEYLHRSLPRGRAQLRLHSPVTDVIWKGGHVEVIAGGKKYSAQRTIITLPLGILKFARQRGGVHFSPELTDKNRAISRLESGDVVKVILTFRSPFWEETAVARGAGAAESLRDASFMHDTSAMIPVWWTARPLRVPMLTGWCGGPRATAISGVTKREIETIAVDSLARLFCMRRNRIADLIQSTFVADWPADRFARGVYSYEGIGGAAARRELARPVNSTLFFAGEATDSDGQAGTVAGAIASGQRAARELLAART